jgi:HAD superfamily hydrolase (TIGR01509 family)
MTPIRAVVFDMDGVLIDAKEWHYEALNRALGLLGHAISRYDHVATYDGLPTRKKLEMLSIERGLPRELHAFINSLKQEFTLQIVHKECKPVFQHEFALSTLKADGLALAVASNSVRASVELMMERANLAPYLDVILSNQDVEHAKPHPEIFQVAMRRLGVAPDETLVVEDNPHGVEAARASGAHVMVVQTPHDVVYDRIVERIRAVETAGVAA